MKTTWKTVILLLCAVLLCSAAVSAEAEETREEFISGDYTYALLEDDTAEIVKYRGKDENLIIPAELDSHTVTGIGDYAFSYRASLTSVTIPDSIKSIGTNPFVGFGSLSNIKVSPDHPYLAVIDGVLFSKPDKRLVCYPKALAATSYSIPQGIRIIGDSAFSLCNNLTSITIPDSVISIGDDVFYSCDKLTFITIPDSVTSIGDSAFAFCLKLTSLSIPDSVTNIGDNAFSGCKNLSSITIPDSVNSIGANPFISCFSLADIKVSPDHPYLTIIDGVLFSKNDKRLVCYPAGLSSTTYSIPQSIAVIGDNAFYGCDKLAKITIPDSVTSIGNDAFVDCSDNLTITVGRESYAKQYCIDNVLNYTYTDANDWLNN